MVVKAATILLIFACVILSPGNSHTSTLARHQVPQSPYHLQRYEAQDSRLPNLNARTRAQAPYLPSTAQQDKAPLELPSSSYYQANPIVEDGLSNTPSINQPLCGPDKFFPSSVPAGRAEVDSVQRLGVLSVRQCVDACCEQGPHVCQYAWLLNGECYAVACEANPEKCTPEALGEGSTYIRVAYAAVNDARPASPLQTPTPLTPQNNDSNQTTATMATTDTQHPTEPATDGGGPQMKEGEEDVGKLEGTTKSGDTPTEEVSNSSNSQPNNTTGTVPDQPVRGGGKEGEAEGSGGEEETEEPRTETPSTTGTTPTPPVTVPTNPSEPTIIVATSGDKNLTLPENQAKIFASTWPEDDKKTFSYHWEKMAGPEDGTLSGKNAKDIVLSELVEGVYSLRLTVHNEKGEFGMAYVNVTVNPKPRVNLPPTIVVSPSYDNTIQLPNDQVLLDASNSEDDLGQDGLTYLWEEVTGPLDSEKVSEDAVLELKSLKAGKYKFKLTVTDLDSAQSVAYVNVTVLPESDYPPTANAGNPSLIHLPKNEVYLDGKGSTDDKGIEDFSWEMVSGNRGVDLEGSSTPVLHVTHLTVGVYVFKLTVTDTSGQTGSATVTVDVKDEVNVPPVVDAGNNMTIEYPVNVVVLEGRSDDHYRIVTYNWTQVRGPSDITLADKNTSRLSVSNLHIDEEEGSPTLYAFQLQVTDHKKLTSEDVAFVEYHKDPSYPPHVDAGHDLTITLPENTAVLDGSLSADDFGIVSYMWKRSGLSPAAGTVVGVSNTQPVLLLSNLINGTYNFSLTVTNKNQQRSTDTVLLTVLANPHDKYIVEVSLDIAVWNFTQAHLDNFRQVINLALKESTKRADSSDYEVVIQGIRQHDSHTVVEFYVLEAQGSPVNATDVYHQLTEKGQDYHVMGFHVVAVQTKECILTCSGHGSCDWRTKRCVCDTFWMENPIAAYTGKKESNCQWSVFYVVLVILCIVMVIIILTWMCCCCCLRKRRVTRTKKRIKYAILDTKEGGEEMRMLPRGGSAYQETSLMVSESDTEEEIIFDSSRKSRSPASNGSARSGGYSSLTNRDRPK